MIRWLLLILGGALLDDPDEGAARLVELADVEGDDHVVVPHPPVVVRELEALLERTERQKLVCKWNPLLCRPLRLKGRALAL